MNISAALKYCKASPLDSNTYEKHLSCVGVTPLNSADSHICSVRNVKFWTKTLDGTLLGNERQIDEALAKVKTIGVLFIGAAPLQWCSYTEKIAQLMYRAKKVVWLNDDYTIETPSIRTKSDCHLYKATREITQRDPRCYKVFGNSNAAANACAPGCFNKFDFNLFSWDAKMFAKPRAKVENKTLVGYYGSCRINRRALFGKWFTELAKNDDLTIQSKSPLKKWQEAIPGLKNTTKTRSIDEVTDGSEMSVYMQDEKANDVGSRVMSTPSTRIYEMACRHWPFVITEECRASLDAHDVGFPDEWYVSTPSEIYMVNTSCLRSSHERFWSDFDVINKITVSVNAAMKILEG